MEDIREMELDKRFESKVDDIKRMFLDMLVKNKELTDALEAKSSYIADMELKYKALETEHRQIKDKWQRFNELLKPEGK